MVLTQVQHEPGARDLAVERGGVVEPVVPVDGEAEVVDVELVGFSDGEDTQDRDQGWECDGRLGWVMRWTMITAEGKQLD